jgi:dihydrofolate reductase
MTLAAQADLGMSVVAVGRIILSDKLIRFARLPWHRPWKSGPMNHHNAVFLRTMRNHHVIGTRVFASIEGAPRQVHRRIEDVRSADVLDRDTTIQGLFRRNRFVKCSNQGLLSNELQDFGERALGGNIGHNIGLSLNVLTAVG